MRILVTGATGFIGRNLVERLVKEGNETYAIVRGTSKTEHLNRVGACPVTADVTDRRSLSDAVYDIQPEAVIHAAALVMSRDENALNGINADGTFNVCKACYDNGINRFVYLSSIAVVNGNPETVLTDNMPYSTNNAYGRSKIRAERIVRDFRSRGLPSAIIRPCMVYGEDEPHAFGRIMELVRLRCLPVPGIHLGNNRLQMLYVGNLVDVLISALEQDEALEGTFLLTDEDILTYSKFLEILYDESGRGKPFVLPEWIAKTALLVPFFGRYWERLFRERLYDISRAKQILGYSQKYTAEEGLRRTVRQWMNKYIADKT